MVTREISAVILAGGSSKRMGRNKLFMPLGERPLVVHLIELLNRLFAQTIVVTDEPDLYRPYQVDITSDLIITGHKNSLAGIHAGLVAASCPYAFITAGDMPFLEPEVARLLCERAVEHDAVVSKEGPYFQPLCAVYHKRCVDIIERQIALGQFRLSSFLDRIHLCEVEQSEILSVDADYMSFFNINTPEDYAAAQKIYTGRQLKKEV